MNRLFVRAACLSLLLLALSFVASCAPSPGAKDDHPPPDTPSLTAKARHQSVQLSWSQVDNAEEYLIYWSPTRDGTRDMPNPSFVTKELSFKHDGLKHEGLNNGQTYYYAVAAWKDSNGKKSDVIAATPQSRPDTPQQVSAVAHNSEVALSWQSASNATNYQIQTVNDSGIAPASVIVAKTTTASFESRNLENGTRYYFVVTASNDYGESDASQKIYATPTSFLSLAAGQDHTCALKTDLSVWCWGGNAYGQLANGNTEVLPRARPTQVNNSKPATPFQTLVAGAAHSCGVKSDHTLWCWGSNKNGQLGIDSLQPDTSPVMKQEASYSNDWSIKPNTLALGTAFSCALKTQMPGDGNTLWCWGDNAYGQMGIRASGTGTLLPTQVGSDADWASVFAGMNHVCGIKTTGELFCWGSNDQKQLGRADNIQPAERPQPVAGSGPWIVVGAGLDHTCAIKIDQSLWCWGNNYRGVLGNGVEPRTTHPVPVQVRVPQKNWSTVTAGQTHTCAIDVAGGLWCWGGNIYGQLGNNSTVTQSIPMQIEKSQIWQAVTAGNYHTCAFTLQGQISCWGYNAQEQLGDGDAFNSAVPVRVRTATEIQNSASEKKDWQRVYAGGAHSCAIDDALALWCWGNNVTLASRTGTTIATSRPVRIDNETGWSSAALGGASWDACGLKNGKRVCWQGAAWNITQDTNNWSALARGGLHFCALSTAGAVECWGRNVEGQLGNGGTIEVTDMTKAIKVGADTDQWTNIATQADYSCALKIDPTNTFSRKLWCWGKNAKLLPESLLVPVETGGDDWEAIALGGWHRCGIKSDKTLACSGDDTQYQLKIPVDNPVAQWTAIAAGNQHTCAVRSDNRLLCWGRNNEGQLGNGSKGSTYYSPTAVMIGPDPLSVDPSAVPGVAAGTNHVCAIHTDRSLWCWGDNSAGQLGDGTAWKETPQWVKFPD